jgi:hypothetical protein
VSDPPDGFRRRRLLAGLGAVTLTGVAGCASLSGPRTATRQRARIVIVLTNADDTEREYEVEVDWSENNRSVFTGVLQPGAAESEMVATTGTAPESATFLVDTADSARSGTWSPTDCPDYRVDAVLENGDPSFDTRCQA